MSQLEVGHHEKCPEDKIRKQPVLPDVPFWDYQRDREQEGIQKRQADKHDLYLFGGLLVFFAHLPTTVFDTFQRIEGRLACGNGHSPADRSHHQQHERGQSEPTPTFA